MFPSRLKMQAFGHCLGKATELQVDYELFCANYQGPYLPDPHVGFAEMMRYWRTPWAVEGSCLNDRPNLRKYPVLRCPGRL